MSIRDESLTVGLSDLPQLSGTQGLHLFVIGRGTLEDAAVDDLRYRSIHFKAGFPGRFSLRRCRLSGWQVGEITFSRTRFEQCHLTDMDLGWVALFPSMRSCRLQGRYSGMLDRSDRPLENDFSQARAIEFSGGISWDANVMPRPAPDTLLVTRDHPAWKRAVERANAGDAFARHLVASLADGPQRWSLLYKEETSRADWTFYSGLFGQAPGAEVGASHLDRVPSFGNGLLFVFASPDDTSAIRWAPQEGTPPFEGSLTASLLTDLALILQLEPKDHWESVLDSADRWIVRLSPELCRAVTRIPESETGDLASRAWGGETDPLSQVEQPEAFLRCLRDASLLGPNVYLAMIAN